MMPVIIYDILWSMEILKNGLNEFTNRCVKGIKADVKKCREYAERSISIVTALNPIIGYMKAAEIAKEAVRTGRSIIEVIKGKDILSDKEIKRVLNLKKLTHPGL